MGSGGLNIGTPVVAESRTSSIVTGSDKFAAQNIHNSVGKSHKKKKKKKKSHENDFDTLKQNSKRKLSNSDAFDHAFDAKNQSFTSSQATNMNKPKVVPKSVPKIVIPKVEKASSIEKVEKVT